MSIPITLLTGFLGSGKTTFVNRLLRSPLMQNALVVVNEVGDVSIDHLLVREIDERTVVLPSGCLCCTLREDLLEVLENPELLRGRDHIVVETSGLADPTPLVATVVRHPSLRERFHLSSIVATLDASDAENICTNYVEASKQLALADHILITKCDLASPEEVLAAEAIASSLSPTCTIARTSFGVFDGELASPRAGGREVPADSPHRHTHGIRTFSVESSEALEYSALAAWLSTMSQFHGERLLRFKGLAHVTDEPGPVVLQAVQHVVYPVYSLPEWPDGVARTRLTGITHGMSEELFESTLRSLREIVKDPHFTQPPSVQNMRPR